MNQTERRARILRELELRGMFNSTDFAERAGVSVMTVRRDLQDLEAQGRLERVHGGAVSHGGPAASTSTRAAITLGLIVPSTTYYYPAVIAGARTAGARLGARLVLATSHYSAAAERHSLDRLVTLGVDGLVATPADTYDDDRLTYERLAAGPPAVLIERHFGGIGVDSGVGAVATDHAHGAQAAVRHLADLGHRSIMLACRRSPTATLATAGFRGAMAALAPEAPAPVRHLPDAGMTAGRPAALDAVIDDVLAEGVTAIIVLPDEDAIGLSEAAADRGIVIPDDLSIVAYDDEVAALNAVPLTAVAPPKFEVGYQGVRSCVERVREDRSLPSASRSIVLKPVLVERSSTAVAPSSR